MDNDGIISVGCVGRYCDDMNETEKGQQQQQRDADIMMSACQQNVSAALTPAQLASTTTNSATSFEKPRDHTAVQDCLSEMTRLTDTNSATC